MNRTVLLLEDDPDIIVVIEYILQEAGCKVVLGNDKSYFTDIKNHNPGVILLDYWLYHTLGSEICYSLKSNPATAHIPIILMSAVNNIGAIGKECNVEEILAKPFDIADLEAKVLKWLPVTA